MSTPADLTVDSMQDSRRPGPKLNSRSLTLLFGGVLFCPIAIIAFLYLILPAAHDRPLPVQVTMIDEVGKSRSMRLVNAGDVALQSVRIEVNGAFAYFPQAPLQPKDEVEVSLDWFMKKTGQHLDPDRTEIRTVHVSARLPGNQRAVTMIEF